MLTKKHNQQTNFQSQSYECNFRFIFYKLNPFDFGWKTVLCLFFMENKSYEEIPSFNQMVSRV
ncbi:hypothetical protein Avbf_17485 [Armadillidium vulgare]|nr:hypothetical protein Avbf_17485 [Armadillidium vulgare]